MTTWFELWVLMAALAVVALPHSSKKSFKGISTCNQLKLVEH
jgi:hypothetical protein